LLLQADKGRQNIFSAEIELEPGQISLAGSKQGSQSSELKRGWAKATLVN
jgi:hypothetical protein